MPQDIQSPAPQKAPAPQHFGPPSAREMRTQAVHRLQVGLFGLCAMLLLVVLANIVMDRARSAAEDKAEAVDLPQPEQPGKKAAVDPLADMGVVPPGPTPEPTVTPEPAPLPTLSGMPPAGH